MHSLTPKKLAAVSVVFQDDIRKRSSPSKKRVVNLMGSNEVLRKIVHYGEKVKWVVDCVWYLIQSHQPVGLTNLPEEDPGTTVYFLPFLFLLEQKALDKRGDGAYNDTCTCLKVHQNFYIFHNCK